ncbi:MAG: helix-turn-helix domain-containing protein [Lentisphaeria bacterium]|nr:helix-turn-helix domain-containing protein [Lentisphaeria bacterium]
MTGRIVFSYAGHYRDNLPNPHHSHRGTELVFILKGYCETAFDNGATLSGGAGTVFVTPPELAHQQSNTPDCETLYVVQETADSGLNTELRSIETGDDPLLRQWFMNLLELNSAYVVDQASALLEAVWARLAQIEQQSDHRNGLHGKVRSAIEYLEQSYMKSFSVSGLAARIGVSQSHLNSLFRQSFGVGPQTYLTAVRMRQARLMLLNPYFNIAEVAEKTGYREANYFTRIFRQFHGVTPGEYRKAPSETADQLQIVPGNGRLSGGKAGEPRLVRSNSIIS